MIMLNLFSGKYYGYYLLMFPCFSRMFHYFADFFYALVCLFKYMKNTFHRSVLYLVHIVLLPEYYCKYYNTTCQAIFHCFLTAMVSSGCRLFKQECLVKIRKIGAYIDIPSLQLHRPLTPWPLNPDPTWPLNPDPPWPLTWTEISSHRLPQ